jgi:ketosteroid isomerase-like protein
MGQQRRDFDAGVIDAWVAFWNTYDLTQFDRLFVTDDRVSYFSSEKVGLIKGVAAVRKHHEGFGFVPGGKVQSNKLSLEQIDVEAFGPSAIVTAIWKFARAGSDKLQRGPVTLVYTDTAHGYRIAHANFGNYPETNER